MSRDVINRECVNTKGFLVSCLFTLAYMPHCSIVNARPYLIALRDTNFANLKWKKNPFMLIQNMNIHLDIKNIRISVMHNFLLILGVVNIFDSFLFWISAYTQNGVEKDNLLAMQLKILANFQNSHFHLKNIDLHKLRFTMDDTIMLAYLVSEFTVLKKVLLKRVAKKSEFDSWTFYYYVTKWVASKYSSNQHLTPYDIQ
jgi:hypothetical protein